MKIASADILYRRLAIYSLVFRAFSYSSITVLRKFYKNLANSLIFKKYLGFKFFFFVLCG